MTRWGSVIAIEAQERIYYALAGNVAINNCFNATLIRAVAGDKNGMAKIPELDHFVPTSFGSLELKPTKNQNRSAEGRLFRGETRAGTCHNDQLAGIKRLDLLKIDVEGMECEVLEGAKRTVRQSLPVVIVEHLKAGPEDIVKFLTHYGYNIAELGVNILAIHSTDRTAEGFGPQARRP